jgi:hypothetical protein
MPGKHSPKRAHKLPSSTSCLAATSPRPGLPSAPKTNANCCTASSTRSFSPAHPDAGRTPLPSKTEPKSSSAATSSSNPSP